MPNALLVYPEFPPSYWGMQYALEFLGKKASMPPLGLLTVAAMFPAEYSLRVVDMNIRPVTDEDIKWADAVFTSSMVVQQESLREVVEQCRRLGVPIVAGGPYPTTFYDELEGVDYFVLGEVEEVFHDFLRDLKNGCAPRMCVPREKPDVTRTPLPRYDLIDLREYSSMSLQFSRGCPFDCEFCDITKLFGRVARTKTNQQVLGELDLLYRLGWRGSVFLVDDNFIGNKKAALELLPDVSRWQRERGYPFSLFTEASVNLARMDSLMDAMVDAGFSMVFLGIESPNPAALLKTNKKQNVSHGNGNFLLEAVRKIQHKGMEVAGGFIVGLDGDGEGVFDAQIDFIQEAGIPLAMIGLLTALKGTDLYDRLKKQGRLVEESQGDNFRFKLNFVPEMDPQMLFDGYRRVLSSLYDPGLKRYFERCLTMLAHLRPTALPGRRIGKAELGALFKSIRRQLFSKQGPAYLKFLVRVLKDYPHMYAEAVRLAIMGYHLERVTSQHIAVHEFRDYLSRELELFKQRLGSWSDLPGQGMTDLQGYIQEVVQNASRRYEHIHSDFRHQVEDALEAFQGALRNSLVPENLGRRCEGLASD
ncbi:MAG TPA: B12-binding domain-containing radical SAM protein [Acidobacteriota bacterium]|nr:B12-binding domain-containing radical SAM protein [Acidobacteriota bacterium]